MVQVTRFLSIATVTTFLLFQFYVISDDLVILQRLGLPSPNGKADCPSNGGEGGGAAGDQQGGGVMAGGGINDSALSMQDRLFPPTVSLSDLPLSIVLSTDNQLIKRIPTLLNSIYMNNKQERVHLYVVVTNDVEERNKKLLRLLVAEKFPTFTLEMLDFNYNLRYTKTLKHVTIATMCRLMLPKILPEIDRVIYLDIDTIVHGPLRKMFEMDIPETGVTGRTSLSPNLINSWLRHDNIWPAIRYQSSKSFNAGVLLVSLETLRRNRFVDRVMSWVNTWGVNDQIAFNLYCNGTYGELPAAYNVFVGQDTVIKGPPVVLHYAGSSKPWNPTYGKRRMRLFWEKYALQWPTGEVLYENTPDPIEVMRAAAAARKAAREGKPPPPVSISTTLSSFSSSSSSAASRQPPNPQAAIAAAKNNTGVWSDILKRARDASEQRRRREEEKRLSADGAGGQGGDDPLRPPQLQSVDGGQKPPQQQQQPDRAGNFDDGEGSPRQDEDEEDERSEASEGGGAADAASSDDSRPQTEEGAGDSEQPLAAQDTSGSSSGERRRQRRRGRRRT
ncbi:unnamed protein product [Vitrella brassicaformis CCMP3155]|uniref:Uncharacterized protein n=2 Tax=Vitrella brassicaformis TaxID=1169539 RepID=A0A0G4GI94_VITBC|nr:unnamed protein product [Vitrella brassicaformis CCMP3155]|eukprot:CEM29492.1 unnamed protein product [Vitrella brassicaformis CCMP3155]